MKTSLVNSPTYKSWACMKDRCKGRSPHHYERYVKRGITVCSKWERFSGFYDDMGLRPEGKELDRIDNDKGYFKENCRWATKSENCMNRSMRSDNKSGTVGVFQLRASKRWVAKYQGKVILTSKHKNKAIKARLEAENGQK